jgi:tetratricopeptide (TPR) repeat protein
LELERWIDLATAYTAAGRDEEAVSAFGQASALLSSLGRDQTENASVLLCNWGLELDLLGRPLDAESKYRQAIDIERADKTEDVSPMLLANYSRTLEELGHLQEAADYASRAYSKAESMGYSRAADISLFERGRVAVAQKDTWRASEIFDLVEPRMRKRFPAGHYGFAILASQRALIAMARGNLATGISLADQAVSIDEAAIASGGDGAHDLPGLLTYRSTVELAASRPDAAATDASRAINLLRTNVSPGTYSSVLGHAYLALGRALRVQGKAKDAKRAFRSAAENLQSTIGPDHPDTRSARQLAEL